MEDVDWCEIDNHGTETDRDVIVEVPCLKVDVVVGDEINKDSGVT